MTTPAGRPVEIDVEIAPLIEQLWRLGYATRGACQDAAEAILRGGTRTAPPDRPRAAARNAVAHRPADREYADGALKIQPVD